MTPINQQIDSAFHELRECFKSVDDVLEGRLDPPLSARRVLVSQMQGYAREIEALVKTKNRQAAETPQDAPNAEIAVLTPSPSSDAT